MITYYWEGLGLNPSNHGQFEADSDEEALKLRNLDLTWCLYKESNTPDGTPFIMLYENDKYTDKMNEILNS